MRRTERVMAAIKAGEGAEVGVIECPFEEADKYVDLLFFLASEDELETCTGYRTDGSALVHAYDGHPGTPGAVPVWGVVVRVVGVGAE